MAKTKTKVGTLLEKGLQILEGKGHYALAIQIEDGKIKVWRFSPGKELEQVHEVGSDQLLMIDGNHAQALLHPQGVATSTLKAITHTEKSMDKVLNPEGAEEENNE